MVDEEILAAVFEIREIQQQIAFELYHKLNCKCFICNTDLMISKISRDHVFPKSLGFKLCRNMMPVHRGCNSKKGNTMPTSNSVMQAKTIYSSIGLEFKPQRVITDFYPNRILKLAEKSIRVAQRTMKIVASSSLKGVILNKLLPTIDSTFPSISHKRPKQVLVLDKSNGIDGVYFKKYKSIVILNTKNFELTFFHEYIHFIQDLAGQRFDNSVEYNNRRHEIEARTLSERLLKKIMVA